MAGCTNAVTGMLACILCDKKAILLVKTINENNRRNRNDVNAWRGVMSLVEYVWQAAAGMQQINAQSQNRQANVARTFLPTLQPCDMGF